MKISELIEILAKALREHGDVEVVKGIGTKTEPIIGAKITKPKPLPIRL